MVFWGQEEQPPVITKCLRLGTGEKKSIWKADRDKRGLQVTKINSLGRRVEVTSKRILTDNSETPVRLSVSRHEDEKKAQRSPGWMRCVLLIPSISINTPG